MDQGKSGHQLALNSELYKQILFVLALLYFVSGSFMLSIVVFLRKDFGERFLSTVNLVFGYLAIGLFTGLGGWAIASLAHESMSQIMPLFVTAFVSMSVYHRREVNKKNKAGVEWHSYYGGTSLLKDLNPRGNSVLASVIGCSDETLKKWIEPGLVIVLAYFMHQFHGTQVATWLFISGGSLMLHEHISYYFDRMDFLDKRDAMIEAKYWQAAMQGKSAKETAGYVIAQSSRDLLQQQERMQYETPSSKDPRANLDPELRDILDKDDDLAGMQA